MIAPGVDLYELPAYPATHDFVFSEEARSRVIALSPNVDVAVVHQFFEHFGFSVGLRGGAGVSLDGTHGNRHLAGQVHPDVDVYAGLRF